LVYFFTVSVYRVEKKLGGKSFSVEKVLQKIVPWPLHTSPFINVSEILIKFLFWEGGGSATPCASPPPQPSIFSDYSFWVHHPINWDDRHLLAQAKASDFSVAYLFFSKRIIVFCYGSNSTPYTN
jgi:hypothetical protein